MPELHASSVLDAHAVEASAAEILRKWSPAKARKLIVEWALADKDQA